MSDHRRHVIDRCRHHQCVVRACNLSKLFDIFLSNGQLDRVLAILRDNINDNMMMNIDITFWEIAQAIISIDLAFALATDNMAWASPKQSSLIVRDVYENYLPLD